MSSKIAAVKGHLSRVLGKRVLIGAASAIGTTFVTVVVPLGYTSAMEHFVRQKWVGIFNESDEGPSAGKCRSAVSQALLPQHQSVEYWHVSVRGKGLSATVDSEDGTGHGEIVGYEMLRNGSTKVDTISAAFKGAVVGRGVYYLERIYTETGRDVEWWRGIHIEYDCERGRILKCPYVLGEEKDRSKMNKDRWLAKSCIVEDLPSNVSEVSF